VLTLFLVENGIRNFNVIGSGMEKILLVTVFRFLMKKFTVMKLKCDPCLLDYRSVTVFLDFIMSFITLNTNKIFNDFKISTSTKNILIY